MFKIHKTDLKIKKIWKDGGCQSGRMLHCDWLSALKGLDLEKHQLLSLCWSSDQVNLPKTYFFIAKNLHCTLIIIGNLIQSCNNNNKRNNMWILWNISKVFLFSKNMVLVVYTTFVLVYNLHWGEIPPINPNIIIIITTSCYFRFFCRVFCRFVYQVNIFI